MSRQLLLLLNKQAPLGGAAVARRSQQCQVVATSARSFTTKREKRAVNLEPITNSNIDASSGPSETSSGGSSNVMTFAGIAALAAIGAAGTYYYNSNDSSPVPAVDKKPTVDAVVEVKKEVVKPATTNTTESVIAEVAAVVEKSLSSIDADGNNRVRQIHYGGSPNSSSRSTTIVGSVEHPIDGHRVTGMIPTSNTKTDGAVVTDTLMTDDAIRELRTSMLEKAYTDMLSLPSNQSKGSVIINHDDALCNSLESCQIKIIQLYSELKDRTSHEALRLKEFLYHHEKDISQKYIEVLQKQRLEYENILQTKLREQENELLRQMNHTIQEKDAAIHHVVQSALDIQKHEHELDKEAHSETLHKELQVSYSTEYSNKLEEYKRSIQNELQSKIQTLNNLQNHLSTLQHSLHTYQLSQEGSNKAHRLSAAALAFAEKLETSDSASIELKTLQNVSGKDGVIVTALSTIPDNAVHVGIPTTIQLQKRFTNDIYPQCKTATNIPTGRICTLEGQLTGMLFSMLKLYPSSGIIALDDDDSKNNPEYILERAKEYINNGQIELALYELDHINKASSEQQQKEEVTVAVDDKRSQLLSLVLNDWKQDAIHRITIDKALKVIKMECALLNESCL